MHLILPITAAIGIFARHAVAVPVPTVITHQSTTYFDSMLHKLNHHKKLDAVELKSIRALHQWHSHLSHDHKSSLSMSLEDALQASMDRAYSHCRWNETSPEYTASPTANQSLLCSHVHIESGQKFATSMELAHWVATVKMGIVTLRERVTAAWIEKSEMKVSRPLGWLPVYHPGSDGAKRDSGPEKRETTDADGDVQVLKPTHTKGILEHMATNLLCILGISKTICHDN